MEWITGEPKTANWYLATYLTNDDPAREAVTRLWFNPDAICKWWIGTAVKSERFEQPVTHYMPVPNPPNKAMDMLFEDAQQFAIGQGEISVSKLQRHLHIVYSKAARILDELIEAEIVEDSDRLGFYTTVPVNKTLKRTKKQAD